MYFPDSLDNKNKPRNPYTPFFTLLDAPVINGEFQFYGEEHATDMQAAIYDCYFDASTAHYEAHVLKNTTSAAVFRAHGPQKQRGDKTLTESVLYPMNALYLLSKRFMKDSRASVAEKTDVLKAFVESLVKGQDLFAQPGLGLSTIVALRKSAYLGAMITPRYWVGEQVDACLADPHYAPHRVALNRLKNTLEKELPYEVKDSYQAAKSEATNVAELRVAKTPPAPATPNGAEIIQLFGARRTLAQG